MKEIALLLVLTLILSVDSNAQSRKKIAREHIISLNDGVILCRLQRSDERIAQLDSLGLHAEAEEIRKSQKQENEKIVKAFESHFDFCDVYFFYSDNVDQIKRGDYSFLLEPDDKKIEKLKTANIYFAAYKLMPHDTEFNSRSKGIVIMDSDFHTVEAPFPAHYRRKFFSLKLIGTSKLKRRYNYFEAQIEILDKKLFVFYNRTIKKMNKKNRN